MKPKITQVQVAKSASEHKLQILAAAGQLVVAMNQARRDGYSVYLDWNEISSLKDETIWLQHWVKVEKDVWQPKTHEPEEKA